MQPADTAARRLVETLVLNGVDHVFCVPGESYLAVLDALHDSPIAVTVCRHEGGAAMMAEAYGKLTGRPGICFVTRGPGATNAAHGIHIAHQDSTPLILFVGQVERGMRIELAAPEARDGIIPGVRTPIILDGVPAVAGRPAPALGAHNAEVLADPNWSSGA